MTKKEHWEKVYTTKTPEEVSWTQNEPSKSLALIKAMKLPHDAPIIDIGGGDSRLVDFLLEQGYTDLTVLDISAASLARCQERLGSKSKQVKWITADISSYEPQRTYMCWHDRAAFHFLTQSEDKAHYHDMVLRSVSKHLIIATFSTSGPKRCSALDVQQYDKETMSDFWAPEFDLQSAEKETHKTPFDTDQDFIYCTFERSPEYIIE